MTLTEEQCWQAVQNRDSSGQNTFVYAVRSTGIYCRPSCPARRPGREQVQFFAEPDSAEAAGFRACRRCRPHDAAAHIEIAAAACRHIEAHADEALFLQTLARPSGLSPAHFQRVFKRSVGVTPREYAAACRLSHLKHLLADGEPVTAALVDAGYGSTSRVYEQPVLGMTPTAYRRRGENTRVSYTLTNTPLGRMLVAATDRGVCAVTLGDSDDALEAALKREYPAAQIAEAASPALTGWVTALVQHLEGQQPSLALPLDVRATAFQRQVWEALQAIPLGETRSYTEVAEAVGRPSAARAVAAACASNPAALAVPCHRVVRGDGSLSGYRWGIPRKAALLAREKTEALP